MPQKGTHDIYIVQAGDEYRVRPAIWTHAGKGSPDPKIRNLTDSIVLLAFPAVLTASGVDEQVVLEPRRKTKNPVAKDHATVVLKPLDKAEPAVASPYTVIVLAPGGPKSAVGESEPIIIIDPPPV